MNLSIFGRQGCVLQRGLADNHAIERVPGPILMEGLARNLRESQSIYRTTHSRVQLYTGTAWAAKVCRAILPPLMMRV